MSMQDPIADLLTCIRNGQSANKQQIRVPSSKIKAGILQVLLDEGYILGYSVAHEHNKSTVVIDLKYYNDSPVIRVIKRCSSPGLRRYYQANKIPKVLNGLGLAIVSTTNGIMSGSAASKLGVGGELLCVVE